MSQNNNFAYQERKMLATWPGIIQQPVNAGSCRNRIGVKTAKPGVDYRPH